MGLSGGSDFGATVGGSPGYTGRRFGNFGGAGQLFGAGIFGISLGACGGGFGGGPFALLCSGTRTGGPTRGASVGGGLRGGVELLVRVVAGGLRLVTGGFAGSGFAGGAAGTGEVTLGFVAGGGRGGAEGPGNPSGTIPPSITRLPVALGPAGNPDDAAVEDEEGTGGGWSSSSACKAAAISSS